MSKKVSKKTLTVLEGLQVIGARKVAEVDGVVSLMIELLSSEIELDDKGTTGLRDRLMDTVYGNEDSIRKQLGYDGIEFEKEGGANAD